MKEKKTWLTEKKGGRKGESAGTDEATVIYIR